MAPTFTREDLNILGRGRRLVNASKAVRRDPRFAGRHVVMWEGPRGYLAKPFEKFDAAQVYRCGLPRDAQSIVFDVQGPGLEYIDML